MFKKLITLMLAVSIFTVSAQASTQNGLKAAFDELNYSLTVEWDQKDQKFYEAQMKAFTAQVKDLKAKGMTDAQFLGFVKSELKNEKIARDLETTFNMISINKLSGAEAQKFMMDSMQKSYANGASWNGTVSILASLGVLLLVAAVIAGGSYVTTSTTYYGCYETYVCGCDYTYGYCEEIYCCY